MMTNAERLIQTIKDFLPSDPIMLCHYLVETDIKYMNQDELMDWLQKEDL